MSDPGITPKNADPSLAPSQKMDLVPLIYRLSSVSRSVRYVQANMDRYRKTLRAIEEKMKKYSWGVNPQSSSAPSVSLIVASF